MSCLYHYLFLYLLIHLGSVHTWCEGTLPKYGTRWALMWTYSFSSIPTLEFGHLADAQVQGLDLLFGQKSRHRTSVCNNFCKLRAVHCFVLAAQLVSKWCLTGRNGITMYTVSHISGTQSVNTTPFCAGVQSLVLGDQVWTAPSSIIYFSYFRHCFL